MKSCRCTEEARTRDNAVLQKVMTDVLLKTNGCGFIMHGRVHSPLFTLLKSLVKTLVNIQYHPISIKTWISPAA